MQNDNAVFVSDLVIECFFCMNFSHNENERGCFGELQNTKNNTVTYNTFETNAIRMN